MTERVLHPLRGSEDEPRVLTREQRNALEILALSCDEMSAIEWGENGSAVVLTYRYDEQGHRLAEPHTISRGGIPV